jgi:hypothetical protein
MVPDPDYCPASYPKLARLSLVTSSVVGKFFLPERHVCGRSLEVNGTHVPETSVYEDRHFLRMETEIGSSQVLSAAAAITPDTSLPK